MTSNPGVGVFCARARPGTRAIIVRRSKTREVIPDTRPQTITMDPLLRVEAQTQPALSAAETAFETAQVTSRDDHAQEQRHEARFAITLSQGRRQGSHGIVEIIACVIERLARDRTAAATLPFVAIVTRGSVLLRNETLVEPSPPKGAAPQRTSPIQRPHHRFPHSA